MKLNYFVINVHVVFVNVFLTGYRYIGQMTILKLTSLSFISLTALNYVYVVVHDAETSSILCLVGLEGEKLISVSHPVYPK